MHCAHCITSVNEEYFFLIITYRKIIRYIAIEGSKYENFCCIVIRRRPKSVFLSLVVQLCRNIGFKACLNSALSKIKDHLLSLSNSIYFSIRLYHSNIYLDFMVGSFILKQIFWLKMILTVLQACMDQLDSKLACIHYFACFIHELLFLNSVSRFYQVNYILLRDIDDL